MPNVPIVIECPECGEQYLISKSANEPSENAVIYSDGYYIDELNWRTPGIIGCVTCELGFEPSTGKVIAEPDWETFVEEYSQIKKAEPPTAGSLALELRVRKKMDRDFELTLRKEFWYAAVHTETGRLLMQKNKKFKAYWEESLQLLEAVLASNSDELMLKAEVNRQLGNFDACIELLKTKTDAVAAQIKEKANQKDAAVFVLKN